MKNVIGISLSFLFALLCYNQSLLAQESKCAKTCIVTKRVAQGGLIGAMVKPVCGEDGLKIFEVVPNTFAEKSNFLPGDIIYEVNGEPVHFTREIKEILSTLTPDDLVEIKYLRDGISYSSEGNLDARAYIDVEVEECCDGSFSVNNLTIGPNPTAGTFRLKFDALINESSLSIQVFNMEGKEIIVEELLNFKGNYNKEYNLNGNGNGIYLLEISNGKQSRQEKIMLQGL